MKNLIAIIKIIRPMSSLVAAAAVWAGAKLSWTEPLYFQTALTSAVVFFLCGAAYIFNDLCDIEIDRVNQPNRVLVKEELSKQTAFYVSIGFNLIALILAALVNNFLLGLTILVIAVFYLFNLKFKKITILGNLLVAFLSGLTFIFGGLAVDPKLIWEFPGPIIGFMFSFIYIVVLMILIGMKNLAEKPLSHRISFLTKIGRSHSALLALVTFAGLVVLSYLPILLGWFSDGYKIIAVYITGLPILGFLIILWGNPNSIMLKSGLIIFKIGLIFYLISFLIA